MNLQTPSTAEISTNIANQLQASLGQAIPFLPKAFLLVLAKVLAGVFSLLWKYVGWGHLQLFVPYASTDEVEINGRRLRPLVEWGKLVGVGEPVDATRAIVDLTVTVTQQTGTLQAGAQLLRGPTGVLYVSTAPVSLNAPTVTVRVRAVSDQNGGEGLGTAGNLLPGDVVSFASPLPNVARDAVVLAQVVTAADAESWDSYRRRILERAQAKPQGGAYADYRLWSREVPGIVSAYPYTGDPGEVDVYVEATVASSGSPDGIPTPAQLDAVENSLEFDSEGVPNRRPANAAINVLPISRLSFNVQITGLVGPTGLEDQIEDALTSYYLEREPLIVGLSTLPRKDRVLQSSVIGLVDTIVNSSGGTVGNIEQFLGVPETPFYTLAEGEKAKLGTVTFL